MTLTPAERELIARFRAALEARFGERLKQLLLFGSRARGRGHEESDLDVLVLLRGLTPAERRAVIDVAFDLEVALDTSLHLSPIVRDATTWSFDTPLGQEIVRDGVAA